MRISRYAAVLAVPMYDPSMAKERVSLHPLTTEEALRAALEVDPVAVKSSRKATAKKPGSAKKASRKRQAKR